MSKGIRRPLAEGVSIGQKFITAIEGWTFGRCVLAGSIRRECAEVGDIDLVIGLESDEQRDDLNARLLKLFGPLKTKPDKGKRSGEFESVQINVIDVMMESFGAALLHGTGSSEFNVVLRRIAKSRGYKLNQYGLFKQEDKKNAEPVTDCFTEESVFAFLDQKFIEPRYRSIELPDFLPTRQTMSL